VEESLTVSLILAATRRCFVDLTTGAALASDLLLIESRLAILSERAMEFAFPKIGKTA